MALSPSLRRSCARQRAGCRFDDLNSASLQALHDFSISCAATDDSLPDWRLSPLSRANSLRL
jgi:hypothetical protein